MKNGPTLTGIISLYGGVGFLNHQGLGNYLNTGGAPPVVLPSLNFSLASNSMYFGMA